MCVRRYEVEWSSHSSPKCDSKLGRRIRHQFLLVWRSENWSDIGVEAHAPEANASHELFRAFEFAIASKDGIDEFTSTVLAHRDLLSVPAFLFCRLPHIIFADFEELVETLPKPLARIEEFVNQVTRLGLTDA